MLSVTVVLMVRESQKRLCIDRHLHRVSWCEPDEWLQASRPGAGFWSSGLLLPRSYPDVESHLLQHHTAEGFHHLQEVRPEC